MSKTGDARKGEEKKGAHADKDARTEVRAVIDRIEEHVAVLSLDDGKKTLDVPLSRLPAGASDGDHLRLTFAGEPDARTLTHATIDRDARVSAEDRIKRMQQRLENLSSTAGKKDFKL
ncbi:MAG: hypothetical protein QOF61_1159 [Acidobacteriota bacterium]|jgi:hypothetical protein|nr:hypothetical protein [Acidobacteriota bacterium]